MERYCRWRSSVDALESYYKAGYDKIRQALIAAGANPKSSNPDDLADAAGKVKPLFQSKIIECQPYPWVSGEWQAMTLEAQTGITGKTLYRDLFPSMYEMCPEVGGGSSGYTWFDLEYGYQSGNGRVTVTMSDHSNYIDGFIVYHLWDGRNYNLMKVYYTN